MLFLIFFKQVLYYLDFYMKIFGFKDFIEYFLLPIIIIQVEFNSNPKKFQLSSPTIQYMQNYSLHNPDNWINLQKLML